jgi:DNA gyrase subunit B
MAITADYGVDSIKTLEGMEAIRTRPGMYIGDVGKEGVWQITLEIISNAIDEYLVGACNNISVTLDGPRVIVADDGRGVPFGKNDDGEEVLVNIYTKLHTGAKFDSDGNTGYNTSGGMNGVGAKATNALSSLFRVDSYRDGKVAEALFNRGNLIDFKVRSQNKTDRKHGTVVQFIPDEEIFKEGIEPDYDRLKKQLWELAYLSPGLKFVLTNNSKSEEIQSENGLLDYIDVLNSGKEKLTDVFYAENAENRMKVRVAVQYTSQFTDTYRLFTNSIPNVSGTHLTGFRTALTQAINVYAREKNLLKEKDTNFSGDDLKEGLTLVLSLTMPDPVFSGQTKGTLTSAEGRTVVQRLCAQALGDWLRTHERDAKTIINKAILARTARERARKAKETVRNATVKANRITLPGKLADCSSKVRSECEVFIVEGDSAAGSAKEARNRDTQAILPIRGKILNVLKADLAKAMGNEEIKSMIIGFGLQVQNNKIILDETKLRYGKIIIMSDADVDGEHIRCLFLTFIWKFCPELIEKGYIYAAVPPLYRIIKGKESFYIKDDAALADYRAKHPGSNYELRRFKGLGEQSVDELAESTMAPNTRTLKLITMDDAVAAGNTFTSLMGESATLRKKFIEENAFRANIDI